MRYQVFSFNESDILSHHACVHMPVVCGLGVIAFGICSGMENILNFGGNF